MTVRPLADEYVTVCGSPEPERLFCFSPGLCRLANGRLVATMDWGGPGAGELSGPIAYHGKKPWQGRACTSDDGGQTWTERLRFPFYHARPFAAGGRLYILGHAGDLWIVRSDDNGDTWNEPVRLTDGETWHMAPCNVYEDGGRIYLAVEKQVYHDVRAWPVSALAPVLLRGPTDADLTRRENWIFSDAIAFRDAVSPDALDAFAVPFFATPPKDRVLLAGREMAPIGWLETNVVRFTDPDHYWHDPTGRTLHLYLRAHTGGTGFACLAKVVEQNDGTMTTLLETVPSGRKVVFIPCPGGHLKFHLLYDAITRLFWLLSSQPTDSMTRAERLPDDRYNLPYNERNRLQLHFSRNGVDWCFAGLVCAGKTPRESRHYASMAFDGDDLLILSRSGDEHALTAHNGNRITFHVVRNFRSLIY